MFATKLRAKVKGELTQVTALINHPMASDLSRPYNARRYNPPHYITEVIAEHNNNRVLIANWSGAISRNPLFEFRFKGGEKGDTVSLHWVDNKGNRKSTRTQIV